MESSASKHSKNPTYYYQTSDLVIIALFASLGGVFSSFIGYFANLVRLAIGLPQGGGQIFAGLHILWFVLVFLLTNRKVGTVILCGIIKGFVELFTASHLGIIALCVSTGEAIVFEIIYLGLSIFVKSRKFQHPKIVAAAGFSAVSNIIIQFNTFLGLALPPELFLLIVAICFASGIGLGGYLGLILYQLFERSGLLEWRREDKKHKNVNLKQESSK